MSDQGLRSYDFGEVYESSGSRLVTDFFIPALNRSTHYDRAVGYFRSSVFHLVGVAMSDFALRRGQMRLICSPSLQEADLSVLRARKDTEEVLARSLTDDIQEAIQDVKRYSVIQLLATLVEHEILTVQITYKPDAVGIFHTKVGIFSDGQDALSFSGSANETFLAWAENEERFHAFASWRTGFESRQVTSDAGYFERLWRSNVPGLVTRSVPDVALEILRKYALPDPEVAVERVRLAYELPEPDRGHLSASARKRWVLEQHQAKARSNWWLQRRGIISFVTGGGKTIAALEILNDWLNQTEQASVIVLVPSSLLSRQWHRELEALAPALSILRVGGHDSDPHWRERVSRYTRSARITQRRVVLAVLNSASTEDFLTKSQVGEHTLVIADEVHRLGASAFHRILSFQAGGRLGLSATPERFGDPEGTKAIFDYFGQKIEPAFTIKDAQRSDPRRLVPYTYHPVLVALRPLELIAYKELSKRIAQLMARASASGDRADRERANLALIERARILKSAEEKAPAAANLLAERWGDGDRWLVYCDDRAQLADVKRKLEAMGHRPLQYFSAMAFSKEATIERFERLGGILLSINCLDEGIDIPSISHALILASSVNPRQHLQRRGRVLRTAPGKSEATIYDVLVQPDALKPDVVFDQDLERASEFGRDADNSGAVLRRLRTLSPYSDPDSGAWIPFEDDQATDDNDNGQV